MAVGRRVAMMSVAAALLAPLAACGRKSRPIPPEGAVYPRHYPDIPHPDGNGDISPRPSQSDTEAVDSERK